MTILSDPRLLALVRKRGAGAGTDYDINWQQSIRLPKWLPRRVTTAVLSQFLHGERVTAQICRSSIAEFGDDGAVQECLRAQAEDEGRHGALFQRYLERVGDIAPIDPALQAALAGAVNWGGPPEGRIAAIHVLLEGEALRMLGDIGDLLPCPLFREITRGVARDEARHVALGKIVLRRRLAALSGDERRAIYAWIEGLWRDCAGELLPGLQVPGIVTARRRREWVAAGWRHHARAMRDIGLTDDAQEVRGRP